jgi:hypothetical protein
MDNAEMNKGIASLLAAKGRGGDSMLVHMTPGEVQGLHSLALAAGGQLTINPHTGLYEANFLKKLLPTLIGAILTPLTGGLINPLTAGLLVGGVEGLRTGDLGRGLMAGLGAWGGAGLGSSLAGMGAAGAKTVGTSVLNPQTGAQLMGQNLATAGGGLTGSIAPAATQAATTVPSTMSGTLANMGAGARKAFGSMEGLRALGTELGPAKVSSLLATGVNAMTPDVKMPKDLNTDPMYYISGGYDPERGFLGGQYTRQYPGFPPRGMAGGGAVAFQEGGQTPAQPLSAANVQYGGSQAEQLQQYMQNLNQSFIPPPAPPKAPPAAIQPQGQIRPGVTPSDYQGINFNLLSGAGIPQEQIANLMQQYTVPGGGGGAGIGSLPNGMTGPRTPMGGGPQMDDYNFGFAAGGGVPKMEYQAGGTLLNGPGDGMSDDIPANINGVQEARLADGEFVVPADVVSHLGNGSTEAGSRKLYDMMDKVRKARTGRTQQAPEIEPEEFMPDMA